MAAPVLFHHPSSLEHDPGPHPEQPARITAIQRALQERDWLGFQRRESPEVTRGQLEAVHPARLIDGLRALCASGGGAIDADTIVSKGSWGAALHSAGGAVAMVDVLLGGEAPLAASVHRPPGHHAEITRAMGFCLFNNVAVAARHARDAHGVGRVLILDFDVHHGNGTQDVFYATDEVLFASIHQSPLYPGTGAPTEHGTGAGAGHTLNMPVPGGSGDAVFTSLVEHVVVPAARRYAPGLILVSAGFDAHADDPLADCRVSDAGYATMASSVRALAAELGVPVGVVLEGGYDLGALGRGMVATLSALAADGDAQPPEVAEHELAAAYRRAGEAAAAARGLPPS
ncbi:histone deacetylase [Baekduia soli]|uniref:Histone deacetylase n=1 Tax=Baekduia soli TaxID=496014 RepID=A0A5B8UA90_9ACTN|nr:histone deacetylase [Baekduia soli]QEC49947.1 histone deacetylase [Baekduia soli]